MGSNRRIQTEETSFLPHNTAKQLSTCPSALEPTSSPYASVPRPSRHPPRPQGCAAGRFKRPNRPALSPALSPHHRRCSRRRRRTACPRSCTRAALRTASCSFPLPCERIKRQRRSGRKVIDVLRAATTFVAVLAPQVGSAAHTRTTLNVISSAGPSILAPRYPTRREKRQIASQGGVNYWRSCCCFLCRNST